MPLETVAPAAPSGQGPSVGKASAPTGTTPGVSGAAAVGKPHFEYTWEDGKKESYATEEDFRKAWREGRLRREDYTKKTQELSTQRKAFEDQRKQMDKLAQDAQKLHGQWKPIDDWMKTRPDVSDYIQKNMRNPSPEAAAKQFTEPLGMELQQTKSQLQQLMEWKQKQEDEARKKSMYDHLATELPDFNPDEIEEELSKFNESPDEDDQRNLASLIYWARKGRNTPRKVGEEIVAGPPPQGKKMPPVPPGKAMRDAPEQTPKSLREAAELYKKKHAND